MMYRQSVIIKNVTLQKANERFNKLLTCSNAAATIAETNSTRLQLLQEKPSSDALLQHIHSDVQAN